MRKPLIMLVVLLGMAALIAPASRAQVPQDGYSPAELEQLLAPIALYPDVLLSTVLIAATYPLEIVQAARWSRENAGLRGEAAVAAAAGRDWDPAVQALVAFPDILEQLDAELDWTQALGEAFLFQESDVMDAVQGLRRRAADTGHLRSDEHVRVVHTERTVIVEPVRERIVHVPWVDTRVVYGPWWHPYHPPVRWHVPPHYRPVRSGVYWSSGYAFSSGFFFTTVAWPQRHVLVVHAPVVAYPAYRRARPVHYVPGKRWYHEPRHRRGVAYLHPQVRHREVDARRLRVTPRSAMPSQGTVRRDSARQIAVPPAAPAPSSRRQTAERERPQARLSGAPPRAVAAPPARAAVETRPASRGGTRREAVEVPSASRFAPSAPVSPPRQGMTPRANQQSGTAQRRSADRGTTQRGTTQRSGGAARASGSQQGRAGERGRAEARRPGG